MEKGKYLEFDYFNRTVRVSFRANNGLGLKFIVEKDKGKLKFIKEL